MAAMTTARLGPPRGFFLNDPVVRGVIYQIVTAVLVVGFAAWIVSNTAGNLAAQNKTTGFDFLWRTAGFDISFSLIPWSRESIYWEAFVVGLINTLLVAFVGIILATMLGFTIGVARLSSNFIIARLATIYVETIRNIPLLLQLFFWYFAVLKAMPAVRDSYALPLDTFINQRGIFVPKPIFDEQFGFVWIGVALAIAAVVLVRNWAKNRLEQTGQRFPVFLTAIALLIGIIAITWVISGASVVFEPPVLERFNFKGGLQLPPEFVALLFGLTIYTATFIAETVRAGIQAVSRVRRRPRNRSVCARVTVCASSLFRRRCA